MFLHYLKDYINNKIIAIEININVKMEKHDQMNKCNNLIILDYIRD